MCSTTHFIPAHAVLNRSPFFCVCVCGSPVTLAPAQGFSVCALSGQSSHNGTRGSSQGKFMVEYEVRDTEQAGGCALHVSLWCVSPRNVQFMYDERSSLWYWSWMNVYSFKKKWFLKSKMLFSVLFFSLLNSKVLTSGSGSRCCTI